MVRKMAAPTSLCLLFSLLILLILPISCTASTQSDALLQLKKSIQNAGNSLSSWTNSSGEPAEPCAWQGVVCFHGIITGLRLSHLGLAGTIDVDALHQLAGLRSISFDGNSLSGKFPAFGRDSALKSIFLQGNRLSGTIPADAFTKMTSLKKLWLSGNNLSGTIPPSLTSLPHLMEVRLENNSFSGSIPLFNQSSLQKFNVSNNQLTGIIPPELTKRFNASSFAGNSGLCTNQDNACRNGTSLSPRGGASMMKKPLTANRSKERSAMIAVLAVVLVVLSCAFLASLRPKNRQDKKNHEVVLGSNRKEVVPADQPQTMVAQHSEHDDDDHHDEEKPPPASTIRQPAVSTSAGAPELVLLQDRAGGGLALTDLMKASAEVLGSGGLGSSYRAVIRDGAETVVVKRMRDMNQLEGKVGFHAHMCRLGRVRHQNVFPPVGYHYRKEEKLLVYDYATNGNLLFLLHGDRRPERPILEWTTRLRIAQGVSLGMTHLHRELADMDLPHGNLKSTNVLFGEDCEPLIAEYGFTPLVNPTLASQNLVALRSPEFVQFRQVCHKSDVWCLGLVILEIVTGKFPSQYLPHGHGGVDLPLWVRSAMSEGRESDVYDPEIVMEETLGGGVPSQMRQLLQIGLACTDPILDKRPDMAVAQSRIQEIRIDQHSLLWAPSLRDGLGDLRSSSRANMSAVFSSRRFANEGFSIPPPHHDIIDTTHFAMT